LDGIKWSLLKDKRSEEDNGHSDNVDGKLELDELSDIVIDVSSVFKGTTIEVKLSSRRIISQAPLATSVPVIPIANPTSALVRAGASLVPSPVTATTPSQVWIPSTRIYLSSGEDLAKTLR